MPATFNFLQDMASLLMAVVINWLMMHGVTIDGNTVVSALLTLMRGAMV